MSLKNKLAIVTAGNSGICKDIALELANTFGDGGWFTVALKTRREDS
jgi:NAD(P)-dependent dehydrogenase (short-subunit alcohol dehydrogenase family)